ncbi:MAG: hypothetical protein KDI44_08660 [Thiothrix sp.]|nr:hypothetical protein [Thiothrix sp.]HPQ95137.1 hypothetical protein [Thiolinea sp.]
MKIKPFILLSLALLPYATTQAQSAVTPKAVATIVTTQGTVLVENTAGQRRLAKPEMPVMQGENVFVLEKGQMQLKYAKSACQSAYSPGTWVNVNEANQCPKGQQLNAQQANSGRGYGAAGSNPTTPPRSWLRELGRGRLIAAGVASVAVITIAAQDDNNDSVSP